MVFEAEKKMAREGLAEAKAARALNEQLLAEMRTANNLLRELVLRLSHTTERP